MPQIATTPRCGKCGGDQFIGHKSGFGAGAGLAGAALFGPMGLAAGLLGSGRASVVCVTCGRRAAPGSLPTTRTVVYSSEEQAVLNAQAVQKAARDEAVLQEAQEIQRGRDERALALGTSRADLVVFCAEDIPADKIRAEKDAADRATWRPLAASDDSKLNPIALLISQAFKKRRSASVKTAGNPTVVSNKTTSKRRDRF